MKSFFDRLFGRDKAAAGDGPRGAQAGPAHEVSTVPNPADDEGMEVPQWVTAVTQMPPTEVPAYSPEQMARYIERQRLLLQGSRETAQQLAAAAPEDRLVAALRGGHVLALASAVELSMQQPGDVETTLSALADAASRFAEQGRLDAASVQWCSAVRLSPASYQPWWGLADVLRAGGELEAAGRAHLAAARWAMCWALNKRRSPGVAPGQNQLMGTMLLHSAVNYHRAARLPSAEAEAAGGVAAIDHLRSFADGEWRRARASLATRLNLRAMRSLGLEVTITGDGQESCGPLAPAIEAEIDALVPFDRAITALEAGPKLSDDELGFSSASFAPLDRIFPDEPES